MKALVILLAMAVAVPIYAETYSWNDNKGTYNYADDLSRVPLKYRNRVIKRGDPDNKEKQPTVLPEVQASKAQKEPASRKEGVTASGVSPGSKKQPYGGKSYDEWQKEFGRQEAELKLMELELAKIRQKISTGRISQGQQAALIKEYGTLQAEYKLKFDKYGELVESAKKTGLTIEMQK